MWAIWHCGSRGGQGPLLLVGLWVKLLSWEREEGFDANFRAQSFYQAQVGNLWVGGGSNGWGTSLYVQWHHMTWGDPRHAVKDSHMPCSLELSLVGMRVCTCVCVTVPQLFTVMLCSIEEADEKCGGTAEGGSRSEEPSLEEVENGLRLGICPRVLLWSYPLSIHCTPGSLHGAGDLRWAEARTSLVVQWLRLCVPNGGDLSSIPGQRTRSHVSQLRVRMPQLEILCAATKTWCHQMT